MPRDVFGDTGSGGTGGLGSANRTTPEEFGAKGDCKTVGDAAITVSQTTLTSASAGFSAGDVGKWIMVRGAGLNINGNCLSAQIQSILSATQVQLSVAAAVTVTNAVAVWGTDDTLAFRNAVNTVVAEGIADGSYFGEVVLSAREYMIASAPVTGGATSGNAQIPLPVIPTSGKKFNLSIKGPGDGSGFYHWRQTRPNSVGATLRSPLIAQTSAPTYGLPSVIGGPTTLPDDAGTVGFSNMLVSIDGLTVIMPRNPSFVGIDLFRIAQANIGTLSVLADGTPITGTGQLANSATNTQGLALRMPRFQNNDNTNIFSFATEGFYYGMTACDHLTAQRLAFIYCNTPVFVGPGISVPNHGIFIGYLSIEASDNGLEANGSAPGKVPIFVARWDTETGTVSTIRDPDNLLTGEVHYADNTNDPPVVIGGGNLRVIDDNRVRGTATPPAIPASTVALQNPFWRDAAVTVRGGTVTAITVDGQTIYTTTDRQVIVPTGKTIALTYSVVPTSWVWTLL